MMLKVIGDLFISSKQSVKLNTTFFVVSFFFTTTILAQTPTLSWAHANGGTGQSEGNPMAIDLNGNVCVTGVLNGTVDFDPGTGTLNLSSNGSGDIFIQKFDANGNLFWAKSIGGIENDVGRSITTDDNGDIYITGHFKGTVDFDPGTGTENLTSNLNQDIFILKLDANGDFVWVRTMGGDDYEYVYSITSDENGNIYTTGRFWGTIDIDPGTGTTNLTSNGLIDFFIQKLDANGNLIWAKSMGGSLHDTGYSTRIDGNGNIYTCGSFGGTADFDPGVGTFNLTANGGTDIFVQKLDSNGDFIWAKSVGSTGNEVGYSLSIDDDANVYTTGSFQNTVDFDPGIGTTNLSIPNGYVDIFIQKLDGDGNFLWAHVMGGININIGYSITNDSDGNVYTTGYFSDSADFDPGIGVGNVFANGGYGLFIQKLDASGNYLWAIGLESSGANFGHSIITDAYGSVYTMGRFYEMTDFDPGVGTLNLTTGGNGDNFIQKLASHNCQPTAFTDVQIACDPYIWIDGATYTTSNNTATYTLMNVAGCDSLVTLDLTINSALNVGVTTLDATLTADLAPTAGASYAWLDCDNAFSPIAGATAQLFSPTANGNYAVQVMENGCTDTSACFVIDNVGLEIDQLSSVSIVPNPTHNVVTITFESSEAKLTILDLNGKVMTEIMVNSGDTVDLSTFEKGVYFFTMDTDLDRIIDRIVKY